MLKDLKRSILRIGLFLLLPVLVFYGCHAKRALVDNPAYASEVFAPVFPAFEVLESRRWHRLGGEAWDCTYAIVAPPADMPEHPPAHARKDTPPWYLRWGDGAWQATPMADPPDGTRDAITGCMPYWSDEVAQRIEAAITREGSHVIIGPVGETVYVYSKPQRIAARIRFGD
ncbi:hypothetical protein C8N43_0932 [Litoreibacter ponti]|uniref:Uncharacterized protein n=1 Tax=Litoreibacter ponti TaxID=1510457 RepID=A0A2T6BJN5_9RHOB|nr:hypothetical protein [Litoreibacter ponti]PTX56277.1 hypothetical protein C8N43_0932 [Litoreibacter ponti]